jgi:hypothetical protein
MSNDEIILFKDKKKFSTSELMNQNNEEVEHNYNFISTSEKFEMLKNYFKELELFVHQLKIKFFQRQFVDSLSKGIIQSIKVNMKLFQGMSEFDALEKKKILILFKIFKSFGEYENSTLFKLSNNNKNSNTKFDQNRVIRTFLTKKKIKYEILKTNKYPVQKLIIEVLILYILSVLSKEIAFKTLLILIEANPDNSSHLKSILEIELVFLLGLFSDLYSNLLKLKIENITDDDISQLEMTPLFLNINLLKHKHLENSKIFIYQELSSIGERKKFIKNNMIQFFKDDLKIYDYVINVTQHVYDYLIIGKIKKNLLLNSTFQFRIFLEIRNVFFEYLNSMSGGEVISVLSERQYFDYSTIKINYDTYFMSNHKKNKLSMLKNIIGNTKILGAEKKMIKEEFIDENELENSNKDDHQILISHNYNETETIKSSKQEINHRNKLKVLSYKNTNIENVIVKNKSEIEEKKLFEKKMKIPKLNLKEALDLTNENYFYKLGIKSKNENIISPKNLNFRNLENKNEKSLSQSNFNKSSNFNSFSNTKSLFSLQLEKFKNSSNNQESIYLTNLTNYVNKKEDLKENKSEAPLPNFSNNKISESFNSMTLKNRVSPQSLHKLDSQKEQIKILNKYLKNNSTNTARLKKTIFINDSINFSIPETPRIKRENLFEKLNSKLKFKFPRSKLSLKGSSINSYNFCKNKTKYHNKKEAKSAREMSTHFHANINGFQNIILTEKNLNFSTIIQPALIYK